jgi:hypothetical protein
MKTLNDLKEELSKSGYEYNIQNNGDGYFLVSVTYDGQFGISNGYDIRSFNTCSLIGEAFIAFNVIFKED